MDIMAATVKTDAMGGFSMHIPNADYKDREIKRGTLMGKAHRIADWSPIDANAAVKMAKEPKRELRAHTPEELEVIRKLITDNVNRTVPRVFKNRLKYDLKSNQIICQKYDFKSQSNRHFQNDLKSKSNQIVSPIGKLFLSFSYTYQPVL
jgi:hypothetical protein